MVYEVMKLVMEHKTGAFYIVITPKLPFYILEHLHRLKNNEYTFLLFGFHEVIACFLSKK